ncbi:hypothetical protein GGQ84_000837 [Desulfitispora alkaliphila]|jgi:hypothetical protein|uniref:hypothetical protein n=1 Tax=Desulfitispora alkaliphila TaxID=622674 RepID=UPI003D1F5221
MTELFKEILQRDFYQEIFDALNGEITNKYDEYDLTMRANVVHEVLEASLDDIQILRVFNFNQEDDDFEFDILVNCDIEIGDYFARESIQESVPQWFQLNCSAVFEGQSLEDFSINSIEAYNK